MRQELDAPVLKTPLTAQNQSFTKNFIYFLQDKAIKITLWAGIWLIPTYIIQMTSTLTRLFVDAPLTQGLVIACDEKRSHYLMHVLRLGEGAKLRLFNGREGEWLASIDQLHKKHTQLRVDSLLREQKNSPDLWLLPCPLKNARTDWVVEKATELGVSRICPVSTRHTVIDRCNQTRLQAIAAEAAEQSERMDVPQISEMMALEKVLGNWSHERTLLYADESGGGNWPLPLPAQKPYAVLVGPEGGFSPEEFALLKRLPFTQAITLGPRILRADTAAIAAITLVQSITGDWADKPAFRSKETS